MGIPVMRCTGMDHHVENHGLGIKGAEVRDVSYRLTLPAFYLGHQWQRAGIGIPIAVLVESWSEMQIQ